MDHWDVVIVGGGPAGSSCAWALRGSGLRVLLLDRARFPRNKVCGGWITPGVVRMLDLDLDAYARNNVLQPISGFRIGYGEQAATDIEYATVVSYGILRCQFDDYLLRRTNTAIKEAYEVKSIEESTAGWIINNEIFASLLVGAGGHFCPVARMFRHKQDRDLIVAQEIEFKMTAEQLKSCRVRPEFPELYFCADLEGYGWLVRKDEYLNVGLGRLDKGQLSTHVQDFVAQMRRSGRFDFPIEQRFNGHAYNVYSGSKGSALPDRVLLIGDALGTAVPQSGEGIGPAIFTGLLAAKTIIGLQGDYRAARLAEFAASVKRNLASARSFAELVPPNIRQRLAAKLLQQKWFCRSVVLDGWFLQRSKPVTDLGFEATAVAA